RLYKNEGVFKDAVNLGTASAYGAAFADVDKDGCSDLLVLDGENTLYKNIGTSFTAWTKLGDNSARACGFFDLDNDLDLDLFLLNTGSFTVYGSDGSGNFVSSTTYTLSLPVEGFSFSDADHDGDLDLYLALDDRKGDIFYENDGNGSFTQSVVGAEYKGYCKSAIFSDVDSDGDTDLFVADEGKGVYSGKSKLYRNEQNDEKWLKVRLKGCYIGAKIKVSNDGFARFGEMTSDELHFGLGTSTGSYTVEVIFPDGTTVKKDSLLPKQVVVISSSGDIEPPDDITNFAVESYDEEIELAWKNPTDPYFAGVKILRKQETYPLTHCDGTVVYRGTGTNFIDSNLTGDVTYFYTAFSFDEVPNYSEGIQGSGTPRDITPPGSVTNLSAEPEESRITLSWENPEDLDFAGVKIRRGTLTYPSSVNDGLEVYMGSETTFVDGSLTQSIPYYYSAFSFDEVSNYSSSTKATATPTDTISPSTASDLNLQPKDEKIALEWKNPSDPDFSGLEIRRGTETFPGTISEGVGVYIGSGTTFVDEGLTNGSSCFYSIFTFDEIPNYSPPTMASATPCQDITEPSPGGTVTEEMPDIDALSSTSYWVYWEIATDTESEVTEYELQERVGEGFWVTLGLFSGTRTQVLGKDKDKVYYYRVRPKNSRGIFGSYSTSSDGIRLVSSAKVVAGDTDSFINYTDWQGNKTILEVPGGRFSGTVTLCIVDTSLSETDLSSASPKILKLLYPSATKVFVLSLDNSELEPNGDIFLYLLC
ncbi:MAG: FG-GAP-like repeat-containing protein, partial [Candidatus Desantisbacteria bacterium]